MSRKMQVVALFAMLLVTSAMAEDTPALIATSAAQQEMILEEMRDYVVAPQEISGALAAGNFQGLAEAEPAWAAVG